MKNWEKYEKEIKEPIILTDDERKLCELLVSGWLARDENNALYYFPKKPTKNKELKIWEGRSYLLISEIFEFIKWEDEEPWEVSGAKGKKLSNTEAIQ